jgi:N-acyl homoserine lactone hydrolase
MAELGVRRVDFGYLVRPPQETGTGAPQAEPVLGYLVDHPAGLLLVDTGMGSHPEVDARYRPRRRGLRSALTAVGARVEDISFVVNCHLHFDHCGGNPDLPGRPIFTQRIELETARRTSDYTLPELVDAPGLRYEQLDGEAEILPDVTVMPTPGHTAGHQSLIIRRPDGTVIVAGQSHHSATAYGRDALTWHAHHDAPAQPLPATPDWLDRLQRLDPARVVFAHDNAVWEPAHRAV